MTAELGAESRPRPDCGVVADVIVPMTQMKRAPAADLWIVARFVNSFHTLPQLPQRKGAIMQDLSLHGGRVPIQREYGTQGFKEILRPEKRRV